MGNPTGMDSTSMIDSTWMVWERLKRRLATDMLQEIKVTLERSIKHHSASLVVILLALALLVVTFPDKEISLLKVIPAVSSAVFLTFILFFVISVTLIKVPKMILKEKPKSPVRHLLVYFSVMAKDTAWMVNFIFVTMLFSFFATIFSLNKSMIGAEVGFHWDDYLSGLDQTLLFGKSAHQLFSWAAEYSFTSLLYELLYQSWFYVYYLSVVVVAASLLPGDLGRKYLLASVICWTLGGNVLAAAFSSAGPIFIDIHGDTSYQEHLDKLKSANPWAGSLAAGVKEKLYFSYIKYGYSSISAFPSMHVASTLLIYLLVRESLGRIFCTALAIYFVLIFTGSIALLWHYFVDSIAAIVLAIGSWYVAGVVINIQNKLYP